MRRILMGILLGSLIAIAGCGPAFHYALCTSGTLDCTNGRKAEQAKR